MGNWERFKKEMEAEGRGLMTRMEAAKYLGVGMTTFDKYVARGELKSYKMPMGRLRKFRLVEVDEFISSLADIKGEGDGN